MRQVSHQTTYIVNLLFWRLCQQFLHLQINLIRFFTFSYIFFMNQSNFREGADLFLSLKNFANEKFKMFRRDKFSRMRDFKKLYEISFCE